MKRHDNDDEGGKDRGVRRVVIDEGRRPDLSPAADDVLQRLSKERHIAIIPVTMVIASTRADSTAAGTR